MPGPSNRVAGRASPPSPYATSQRVRPRRFDEVEPCPLVRPHRAAATGSCTVAGPANRIRNGGDTDGMVTLFSTPGLFLCLL